jgi:hypothetical protein
MYGIETDTKPKLQTPARNHYFFGKLLDTHHFNLEQSYFINKRWLLNRLGLGAGVLCGLQITVAGDGVVTISPGVAIDHWGREIIVSKTHVIENPAQPSDLKGQPIGEPISGGQVSVCLAYHECDSNPVSMKNNGCEAESSCVPSVCQERFRIQVRTDILEPVAHLPEEICNNLATSTDKTATLKTISNGPCEPREEACVLLGTLTISEGKAMEVNPANRQKILSNQVMLETISCLLAGEGLATTDTDTLPTDDESEPTPAPPTTIPESSIQLPRVERISVEGGSPAIGPAYLVSIDTLLKEGIRIHFLNSLDIPEFENLLMPSPVNPWAVVTIEYPNIGETDESTVGGIYSIDHIQGQVKWLGDQTAHFTDISYKPRRELSPEEGFAICRVQLRFHAIKDDLGKPFIDGANNGVPGSIYETWFALGF